MYKAIKVCVLAWLAVFFLAGQLAMAQTAEQLQLLKQLSPAQRKEAQNALKQNSNVPVQRSAQAAAELPAPKQPDAPAAAAIPQQVDSATLPFGYDVFRPHTTANFSSADDIPVPVDYVMGPGDTVRVLLYGKQNDQWVLPVTRSGTIEVPELGPIAVVGMRFDALRAELTRRINTQMIGVSASITLGELRSMQIFVTGDVDKPSAYLVSSLATISQALIVAGGPTVVGTLRNIQLKRAGRTVHTLDAYRLLLDGDSSGDLRLQPGDTVFVPPVGLTVSLTGRVLRPAIYELKNNTSLDEAIHYAGGLVSDADESAVQIERINDKGERIIISTDMHGGHQAEKSLRAGDVIRVQQVFDRRDPVVTTVGHLERTGLQQWHEGMKLLDVFPNLKMFKPQADLNYVLIIREIGPDKKTSVVSADYLAARDNPESPANIAINPRDEIRVFSQAEDRAATLQSIIAKLKAQAREGAPEQTVMVMGQVAHAGGYPLEPGMRISDLVRASGQLLQGAYPLKAELTRFQVTSTGGDLVQSRLNINLIDALEGHPASDLELQPLDVLQVRLIPDWEKRRTVSIKGEVRFPGEYVVTKIETLADLIERAGGYTDQAYPRAAVFLREELRKKEQAEMDILQHRLQADLVSQSLGGAKPENAQGNAQAQQLLSQLEMTKAAGRLAIRLDKVKVDSDENIILKDGDQLFVPAKPDSVTLIGELNSPTSLRWKRRWDMPDYISKAGGLTANADSSRIYVIKANGEVEANKTRLWFNYNQIEPGDTIVAPLDTAPIRFLDVATSITQILSQLAISIAAFHTIGIL